VTDLKGSGWEIVATSGDLISGIACPSKSFYGVQFHPEVDLSVNGKQILSNFLFKVALLTGNSQLGTSRSRR
jgi:GMP synthase (glutamine-hydrolysing)